MRVVVTGSSGRIGRYVVQELVDAGHSVLGADIAPLAGSPARTLRVDLTDAGPEYSDRHEQRDRQRHGAAEGRGRTLQYLHRGREELLLIATAALLARRAAGHGDRQRDDVLDGVCGGGHAKSAPIFDPSPQPSPAGGEGDCS